MLFVSEAVVLKSLLIAGPAAMLGAGGCSNTGLAATTVAADPFCAWRLPGRGAPARPLTSLVRLRASWGALEQSAPLSRGGSVPARQVGFCLPPCYVLVPAVRLIHSMPWGIQRYVGWLVGMGCHFRGYLRHAWEIYPEVPMALQVFVEAVAAKRVEESAPLSTPAAWQSYRSDFNKDDGELSMCVPLPASMACSLVQPAWAVAVYCTAMLFAFPFSVPLLGWYSTLAAAVRWLRRTPPAPVAATHVPTACLLQAAEQHIPVRSTGAEGERVSAAARASAQHAAARVCDAAAGHRLARRARRQEGERPVRLRMCVRI